jgi:putative ABC transport system permease protein
MVFFYVLFSCIIAFGVVYNSARIALSERGRELASLRVLGFTRFEVSYILLGELAVLTLIALPLGCVLGYGLASVLITAFSNEQFRVAPAIDPSTYGLGLVVVVAATIISALLVRRRIDRLDLVEVLKTRE